MSYAEIAARGPKQTPEEAAAPQPPQIESSETASQVSLVDVDAPSVRTVPSDFMDNDVQTETQAARIAREEAARAEADLAKKRAGGGGKSGKSDSGKGAVAEARAKASRVDEWIAARVAGLGDTTSTLLVLSNFAAVAAVSSLLGMRAWSAYERGRLGWKSVGLGLGVAGAIALLEGGFARYFYKTRGKKQ